MLPSSRETPVGVLVVDDQLVFREAAREVIEATTNFELLGEAASGEQAIAAVAELYPDLVLVDVRMPGMDGIATATRICRDHPTSVVVLITIDEPPDVPGGVGSCGAGGVARQSGFWA